MKLFKTLLLSSLIIVLLFHSPFSILATSQIEIMRDSTNDPKILAIVTSDDEKKVEIFEEPSEDSTIKDYLDIGMEISILKQYEHYSFVEWKNDEGEDNEENVFQGYIHNNNIQIIENNKVVNIEHEKNTTQTNSNEKTNTLQESNLNSSFNIQNINIDATKSDSKITSNSTTVTIPTQESLQGVALKNKTNIYRSQSRESVILKSYSVGTILKFKTLNSTWYEAKVKVNNKWTIGYIHKSDVEIIVKEQTSLKGIALQASTHIYSKATTNSSRLKSYPKGTILKYKSFSPNWYEARVKVKGKWKTGYIHKKHVENITNKQESLRGIALNKSTRVYSKPNTNSTYLRSYSKATILKYKTFSASWYEARVKYKGKWTIGYIHKSHVENITNKQESLRGIALNNKTRVYSKADASSSILRSYALGTILKYKTFSANWYEARVKYKGKWTTGYIYKKHVQNSTSKQEISYGIALKNPTKVYERAATNSNVLTSYKKGKIIQYKTFTNNWYEATVKINGENKTGYIYMNDVGNKGYQVNGFAQVEPTKVYSKADKNSSVLKSYKKGTQLKYRVFNNNWFQATVQVNGKYQTGYIHINDVGLEKPSMSFQTKYDLSLQEALAIQLKVNPQTDNKYAYVSKSYISGNVVTATALHVRVGPGTSYQSLGTLSKGTPVDIVGESDDRQWYVIKFNHNTWVSATSKDVLYYLDPKNFINDSKLKFQFLDLSQPSGAPASVLNNYLANKGIFKGLGATFIQASKLHGVNDIYLISHALLETGNGTSQLAKGVEVGKNKSGKTVLVNKDNKGSLTDIKTVYNMFGIGAFDDCPVECGAIRAYEKGWTDPAKAILGGAEFIGNDYIKIGQNTLYKMRWNPAAMAANKIASHQYATDIGWAVKQLTTMYNLYVEIGFHDPILDIPVYK